MMKNSPDKTHLQIQVSLYPGIDRSLGCIYHCLTFFFIACFLHIMSSCKKKGGRRLTVCPAAAKVSATTKTEIYSSCYTKDVEKLSSMMLAFRVNFFFPDKYLSFCLKGDFYLLSWSWINNCSSISIQIFSSAWSIYFANAYFTLSSHTSEKCCL